MKETIAILRNKSEKRCKTGRKYLQSYSSLISGIYEQTLEIGKEKLKTSIYKQR